MYGPKFVWVYPGWFSGLWWRDGLDVIDCTKDEMDVAADGHILTGFFTYNPKLERGIAGLNKLEFREIYDASVNITEDHIRYDLNKGKCYDTIWIAGLALNQTASTMTKLGNNYSSYIIAIV